MTIQMINTRQRLSQNTGLRIQTRFVLVGAGMMVALLALLVIAQSNNAYQTAYKLFEGIAVVNSTNVNAAEEALQRLANTSQATADYTALTSDTPLYEQALNNIFRNFQSYRSQMFILQSNLSTVEEQTAFTVADTYTYSRFWRHVSNLMSQRSDLTAARREYLFADAHLRNRIIPALQKLEALNFDEMVQAGKQATTAINLQVLILAGLALMLCALITVLSFWLRRKVRRYLTPGIDLAMVISGVVLFLMIADLLRLPGQLQIMTQNAYFSISGASRVLLAANQANRAESSAIIDGEHSDYWFQQFTDSTHSIELRLCGKTACTEQSFLFNNRNDVPNPQVVRVAQSIAPADAKSIDNIPVLMGNITFNGETAALEKARIAYRDYLKADANLHQTIDAKDTAGAVELNTQDKPGSSEESFQRFVNAMDDLRSINKRVFDEIWDTQQMTLPRNQLLLGMVSYIVVIGLVMIGVYHRYREL